MRSMLNFNVHEGNLEAMVHGYKNALIRPEEYNNLCQCETLGDLKSQLQVTDYGNFLQNESTLTPKAITDRATEKFVNEFTELREWAEWPLSEFLDYISYDYMIANVLKLINGARNGRPTADLLPKCHPLGVFAGMSALTATTSIDEMFETVLIDSPIGKFFAHSQQKDFDELSFEYIRGLLQKNYIEAFYDFCQEIGGETATVMCEVLDFEADRSVITVTMNTLGLKDIQADDRRKLFPSIGRLVVIHRELSEVEDEDQLRERLRPFPEYTVLLGDSRSALDGATRESVEKRLTDYAVDLYKTAIMRQFQYGVFYGFMKLKELEVQNLLWISECITQRMKQRIHEYVQITG